MPHSTAAAGQAGAVASLASRAPSRRKAAPVIPAEVRVGARVFEGTLVDVSERTFGLRGIAGLRYGDAVSVKLTTSRVLRGNVLQAGPAAACIMLFVPLHPDDPLLFA